MTPQPAPDPTVLPRRTVTAMALAGLVAAAIPAATPSTARSTAGDAQASPRPTIVLVHGAFADAAGWSGVVRRLHARGYTVIAPANPLRGVDEDSAYLRSVLATLPGPLVLVGHSYGGEVITNAGTGNAAVIGLVYVAAFAPDEGETSGLLTQQFPGSRLTPDNLVVRTYPLPDEKTGNDAYINPAVFRSVFCTDVPAPDAAVLAATQRPAEVATLFQPSGVPAWRSIRSWYLVAGKDQTIPPAAQRFMAARAHATTVEVPSSHVAMISHPDATTALILRAATAR